MKKNTYLIEYGFLEGQKTWKTTIEETSAKKALKWFNDHYNAFASFISTNGKNRRAIK